MKSWRNGSRVFLLLLVSLSLPMELRSQVSTNTCAPSIRTRLLELSNILEQASAELPRLQDLSYLDSPDLQGNGDPVAYYLRLKREAIALLPAQLAAKPLQGGKASVVQSAEDYRQFWQRLNSSGKESLYSSARIGTLPILYFAFSRGRYQGLGFDRLAEFVESPGHPLYSDAEFEAYAVKNEYQGAAGHDYRVSDIAKIF